MFFNNQLTSWTSFIHALQLRFSPSHFDDPQGALLKLKQKSTFKEHQTQFESLLTSVIGLPPHFFLSCSISGLEPLNRREVQELQPMTLRQAIDLAKTQEEKHNEL